MKKILLIGLAFLITLVTGYKLRLKNYQSVPLPGQSTDEYSNAWVGLSLIRLGTPVGISGLVGIAAHPTYINPDRIFSSTIPGGALPISYPWFDHPPMMGLLSGGFAHWKGALNFEDVSVVVIRKPMLVLGTISVALIFLLASLWFGPLTGIVASILYATSPLVVIGSRMVQAENVLVVIWLSSLLLLTLAQKVDRPGLVRLAAFLAGMAVLFKLSGVVAIISGALLLLKKKRYLAEFLTISLSIAFLFVFYGLAIGNDEFWRVLLSNVARVYGIGLDAVYDLFISTKITSTKYLTDGWPLMGWLGVIYLAAQAPKKNIMLLICLASYLAVYIFFGSASFGWYRIPFMPFLFIAGGYLIASGITGPNSLVTIIALLIPLGVNLSKLFEVNTAPILVSSMRFGVLGVVMLAMAGLVWPENKFLTRSTRVIVIVLLILALVTNIVYLGKIDVNYWYKVN